MAMPRAQKRRRLPEANERSTVSKTSGVQSRYPLNQWTVFVIGQNCAIGLGLKRQQQLVVERIYNADETSPAAPTSGRIAFESGTIKARKVCSVE
jgi:hypothetical protein